MRQAIISKTFTETSTGLSLPQRLTNILCEIRLAQSIEGQHFGKTHLEKYTEQCTSAPGGRW